LSIDAQGEQSKCGPSKLESAPALPFGGLSAKLPFVGVPNRGSKRSKLLTGLFLVVAAAVIGAVLYPVYPCLDCAIRRGMPVVKPDDLKNCGYCYGKGRATVLDHWKGHRDPSLLQPADLRITPR
jgi:hypothetical protein